MTLLQPQPKGKQQCAGTSRSSFLPRNHPALFFKTFSVKILFREEAGEEGVSQQEGIRVFIFLLQAGMAQCVQWGLRQRSPPDTAARRAESGVLVLTAAVVIRCPSARNHKHHNP